MATGYTHNVQDGTISELRPFALQCARAFMMRDERVDMSIPANLVANTKYNDEQLIEAQAELDRLMKLALSDYEVEARKKHEAALKHFNDNRAERALHRQRYENMIAKVQTWQPSSDISSLKEFMLQQLTLSLEHDCDETYYQIPPKLKSGQEWFDAAVKSATSDIAYHSKAISAALSRTKERNLWLDKLRTSLV